MSIFTDEVDAALGQVKHEKNEKMAFWPLSSVKSILFSLVTDPSSLGHHPLNLSAKIVDAWQEDHNSRTQSQQIYVVDAIVSKLKSHDEQLGRLEASTDLQQQFANRLSDITGSVLSAAQGDVGKDKLDLLALIAVSGALVYPNDPLEQSQEFVRIASQLTTTDVLVLRQLAQSQTETRDPSIQPIENIDPLKESWASFLVGLEDLVRPVFYRSAFVRLQALGLVERMTAGFGSPDPPYEVLELGLLFLRYLTEYRSLSLNEQQPENVSTHAD